MAKRRRRNPRQPNIGTTGKVVLAIGGGLAALYALSWGVQRWKHRLPQIPKGSTVPDRTPGGGTKPMDGTESGWAWHVRYEAATSTYHWSIEKGYDRTAGSADSYDNARKAITWAIGTYA
jgi:hypothetical protein